jgi:hypothetical protein
VAVVLPTRALAAPAMHTFAAGQFMHQTYLNAMSVWENNIGLALTGSVPPRAYIPTAHALLTVNQSTANSTNTIVSFGSAGVNNDGMWSAGAPDHFTIQTDGMYYVTGQVHFDLNATGSRAAHILLNGTSVFNSIAAFTQNAVGSGEGSAIPIIMAPIKFVAGTTLYLQVWQSSGGSLNVTTTLSGTFLCAVRVGDSIGGLVL